MFYGITLTRPVMSKYNKNVIELFMYKLMLKCLQRIVHVVDVHVHMSRTCMLTHINFTLLFVSPLLRGVHALLILFLAICDIFHE